MLNALKRAESENEHHALSIMEGEIMKRILGELKKGLMGILCLMFIAITFTGCAVTQKDIEFTWDRMKEYYGDTVTPIPRIFWVDEEIYNEEGYKVLSCYFKEQHLIVLYDGHDYETIEHEFHHALGNNLGEQIQGENGKLCYVDYKLEFIPITKVK